MVLVADTGRLGWGLALETISDFVLLTLRLVYCNKLTNLRRLSACTQRIIFRSSPDEQIRSLRLLLALQLVVFIAQTFQHHDAIRSSQPRLAVNPKSTVPASLFKLRGRFSVTFAWETVALGSPLPLTTMHRLTTTIWSGSERRGLVEVSRHSNLCCLTGHRGTASVCQVLVLSLRNAVHESHGQSHVRQRQAGYRWQQRSCLRISAPLRCIFILFTWC